GGGEEGCDTGGGDASAGVASAPVAAEGFALADRSTSFSAARASRWPSTSSMSASHISSVATWRVLYPWRPARRTADGWSSTSLWLGRGRPPVVGAGAARARGVRGRAATWAREVRARASSPARKRDQAAPYSASSAKRPSAPTWAKAFSDRT